MDLPAQIGNYEVIGLIGRGGMGAVYKARDRALGRLVALKVMTNDLVTGEETRTRFLREARAVSMLQHANIVVVHELGDHNGDPYIAMEFLDGEPLDRIIRSGAALTVLEKTDISKTSASGFHLFGSEYPPRLSPVYASLSPSRCQRKTRGRVDRYSFPVRLFHPLLHTGLIPAH